MIDQYQQNDQLARFCMLKRRNNILLSMKNAHRENSNNFFVFESSLIFSL